MHEHHRPPYVGKGAAGARASAIMDEEQADKYPDGSPARERLLLSAEEWSRQAADLERRDRPDLPLAMTKLRERKRAIGWRNSAGMAEEEEIRLLWSGLELDPADVDQAIDAIVRHLTGMDPADLADSPVGIVAGASFTEGVAAGVLLERMRQEWDDRQNDDPPPGKRTQWVNDTPDDPDTYGFGGPE